MLAVSVTTGLPMRRDRSQLRPAAARATRTVVASEAARISDSASAWLAVVASATVWAVACTRAAAALMSPTRARFCSVVIRAVACSAVAADIARGITTSTTSRRHSRSAASRASISAARSGWSWAKRRASATRASNFSWSLAISVALPAILVITRPRRWELRSMAEARASLAAETSRPDWACRSAASAMTPDRW